MADVFTPPPPPIPVECLAPAPTVRQPSSAWLADYYGPKPAAPGPAPNISINGIDGVWWPPGQAYQYVGRQLYFNGGEVNAGQGFSIVVPDGELWRVNWVAVDWVTNTSVLIRFFLLNAYDVDTGFGYYVLGTQKPTDNDGGTVTFMPGVQSTAPVTQQILEPLPRPLFLYSKWTLQIQLYNGGDAPDFLNSLRADIERWAIVAAPSSGGTGNSTPSDGGFQSGGPYWRMA